MASDLPAPPSVGSRQKQLTRCLKLKKIENKKLEGAKRGSRFIGSTLITSAPSGLVEKKKESN